MMKMTVLETKASVLKNRQAQINYTTLKKVSKVNFPEKIKEQDSIRINLKTNRVLLTISEKKNICLKKKDYLTKER